MKRTWLWAAAGLAIIIVAVAAFAITRPNNPAAETSTPTAQPSATNSSATSTSSAAITYGNSGFSPATITIMAGGSLTVQNTSSSDLQFDSDPHPQHTDDTDLNVGLIAAGASKTITVTKTGNFGFHNHLNPSDTGRITVQ